MRYYQQNTLIGDAINIVALESAVVGDQRQLDNVSCCHSKSMVKYLVLLFFTLLVVWVLGIGDGTLIQLNVLLTEFLERSCRHNILNIQKLIPLKSYIRCNFLNQTTQTSLASSLLTQFLIISFNWSSETVSITSPALCTGINMI